MKTCMRGRVHGNSMRICKTAWFQSAWFQCKRVGFLLKMPSPFFYQQDTPWKRWARMGEVKSVPGSGRVDSRYPVPKAQYHVSQEESFSQTASTPSPPLRRFSQSVSPSAKQQVNQVFPLRDFRKAFLPQPNREYTKSCLSRTNEGSPVPSPFTRELPASATQQGH